MILAPILKSSKVIERRDAEIFGEVLISAFSDMYGDGSFHAS